MIVAHWIKMRDLTDHPKVIVMARTLEQDEGFKSWAIITSDEPNTFMNGLALRCVTCGLLLHAWCNARECGKFVGDDLLLPGMTIFDLDEFAGGVYGFGRAMERVGWATQGTEGVTFPGFKTYNVPLDGAQRQKLYRGRVTKSNGRVTKSNGRVTSPSVTFPLPEEKRREENNTPPPPRGDAPEGFKSFWEAYPRGTDKAAALKAWKRIAPDGTLTATIVAAVKAQAETDQWTKDSGRFVPHGSTWLNGRRWEDEIKNGHATERTDDALRKTDDLLARMKERQHEPV